VKMVEELCVLVELNTAPRLKDCNAAQIFAKLSLMEAVAFTPTCVTVTPLIPKTLVELPEPPEALSVSTCPPLESVEETTVTLALPKTVSVEVVSPLNVVLEPPPEPQAPIVQRR